MSGMIYRGGFGVRDGICLKQPVQGNVNIQVLQGYNIKAVVFTESLYSNQNSKKFSNCFCPTSQLIGNTWFWKCGCTWTQLLNKLVLWWNVV